MAEVLEVLNEFLILPLAAINFLVREVGQCLGDHVVVHICVEIERSP